MRTALFLIAATSVASAAFAGNFPNAESRLAEILARVYGRTPSGNLAVVRFEKADWVDDQRYEIASSPTGVVVRAAGEKGAAFAAARILREVGYRRLAPHPSWEILPREPPKSISLNVSESPSYRSRRIVHDYKWPEARKSGHHEAWAFYRRLGGDAVNCGHAYERFVRHNKAFFAKHPECLALVGGERKGNKLCISNPLLREKFAQSVLDKIKGNPSMAAASVEPSDGGGWCECAECAKIGTPTDRAITLANYVAAAVRREFPGKKVALYAYNQHSPPPNVEVDRDVVVMVATQFRRNGWSADALVREWNRRTMVGVREYYYNKNGAPGVGSLSNVPYLSASVPRFHSLGARYLTAQASDSWGAGLMGLNVAAELMWDVKADPEAVKSDVVVSAFPSARSEMREFFDMIDGEKKMPLSEDLLARMYAALAVAWRSAGDDGERSRTAQMIGYAKYCEALFAYGRKHSEATANSLFEVAAALKPYYLVYTMSFFRDGRPFRGAGKKVANAFDWKTPRPLQPEKWLAEGLANNHRLPFKPVDFGTDLVPAARPADADGAMRLWPLRRHCTFHLWSDGKPFALEVTGGLIKHYRDRGNVKLRLVQIGGESDTGEMETEVWHDESVPPDGERRVVTVRPRHAGLHRLETSDGGDRTLYAFPAELPVAILSGSDPLPEVGGDFWVYVPAGTKVFGFFAKTQKGRLCGPDGKSLFDLEKKIGHFSCEVPKGADGRFWRVQGLMGQFRPMTVPAALNVNPRKCLVPEGANGF